MTQLIGREREIMELDRCMASDQSEFITLCGRRRVGKTFLVEQYFKGEYAFSYVGGHHLSTAEQLQNFAWALQKYSGSTFVPKLASWFEAFHTLEQHLEQSQAQRKVVFIDEMPWIDTPKSKFVSALENFWNGWAARRSDVVFIATGSATSWMTDNLEENQGGLHNRITCKLYLRPFTLGETEKYLQSKGFTWDRYAIVQTYMIMGGVPYYLSLLRSDAGLPANVDRLFFADDARLRNEFHELYGALFKNADNYLKVVRALFSHKSGITRNEIMKATTLQGGGLTTVLANLEKCGFITSMASFGKSSSKCVYRLVDFYTLFYLKFIENDKSKDKKFWSHAIATPKINTWQGITFETVCLSHIDQIKQALGIDGIATEVSTWRDSTAQIDLVIKRADRLINVCEMKFSTGTFNITPDYAQRLRQRMECFREATRTRLGLVNTLVTTYGVGTGNSCCEAQVTIDALFQ
ncbi:MAG: ATP-binding protein [Bacteroidales bacterium]|nr:ATP-binding protein [Bacteroidales bacterium]